MRRVLVTGASGFIGQALVAELARSGAPVRAAARSALAPPCGAESVRVGDLGGAHDWSRALDGVDAVVHLAGPAHARFGAAEVRAAIVEGTARLAAQAEAAGIARFVYMSSIKAASPQARDAYAVAKRAAEQDLLARAALNPVVLRPPLVYAAAAKANFRNLLRLADTPLPLPLAGIDNRRSLVSLRALTEAVAAALRPGHCGVYDVADEPALSTPEIVRALRRGLGRPARLFAAPGVARVLPAALRETLVADAAPFRRAFSWSGEADVHGALAACAAAWKARRR